MVSEKSRITQGQLMLFILQTQIGVGILSLPHDLQSVAKGGAWISALIAGVAVQIIVLLLWALMRRFPSSTVYHLSSLITGRLPGKGIALAYVGFFLLIGGTVMVRACGVVNQWMLPLTPRWALCGLIMVTGIYLARQNLRTIARYYTLITFLILLFIPLVSYAYTIAEFSYMFPILEAGWGNIVKAAKGATTAMYGFEMLLVVYPLVEGKSGGKLKAVSAANGLVTLLYAFLVFTSLIVFSPQQIRLIPQPVLYLFKSYDIHVVDRADLIFLTLWMVTVTASIVSYIYAAATGLGILFHRGDHKKAVPYAALIATLIALIPQTAQEADALSRATDNITYIFLVGLPALLLLLSILLKKKGREQN